MIINLRGNMLKTLRGMPDGMKDVAGNDNQELDPEDLCWSSYADDGITPLASGRRGK
jgi:hypothetical protein